jgi:hypothetical protein
MSLYDNEQLADGQQRWPTVLGSNYLYLVVLVLMIALSGIVHGLFRLKSINTEGWLIATFIMEIAVIGIPPLIYLVVSGMDIKHVARINRVRGVELLLVLGMAVFGYAIVAFINLVWYSILSRIGTPVQPAFPPIKTSKQYIIAILAMAVIPAVVEEFLFRGVILRGYERFGALTAVVVSGVLFGLLHLNLVNLPAIIFLGIMIGYVVVRTDSIFSGMLYHFIQNFLSISLLFLQEIAQGSLGDEVAIQYNVEQMPPELLVTTIAVLGIIAFLCVGLFAACVSSLHRITHGKERIRSLMLGEAKGLSLKEMWPAIVAGVIVIVDACVRIVEMVRNVQ